MYYDHTASKRYAKFIDLYWDEAFAERIDLVAHAAGITQNQFDVLVREYAWRVKTLFTPSSYGIFMRIALALHFLNPFSKDT